MTNEEIVKASDWREHKSIPTEEVLHLMALARADELRSMAARLEDMSTKRNEILAMLREVTFRADFGPNDLELERMACEMILSMPMPQLPPLGLHGPSS